MKIPVLLSTCFLLSLLATSMPGCIALNIPSDRYHDPEDRGGLLGPWTRDHPQHPGATRGMHDAVPNSGPHAGPPAGCGIDGGPLEFDPFDSSVNAQGKSESPKIPWPRFHPVPTRPVFGSTDL